MALAPGSKIGPYEIVGPIGEGGMGQVWRARDGRLGRDVAIKVLPPSVAADADRLARFHREAQVLASLNHPNVGAIYGVENAGDAPALVLELVEGPTLADRIARGPMPPDEAVPIARQIAEALEFAHERGIVHRDLKPGNVKLDPEGRAKVLDFGLAKAVAGDPTSARSDPSLAMSPTITSLGTMAGTLLGTAAYMSPEQARGTAVDRRADIWAFGALLWEMLTGRRAFEGDTVSDTLAAVLRAPIEWGSLPPGLHPTLRLLIGRCLERDPRKRLRDIGEARIALESYGAEAEPLAATTAPAVASPQRAPWRAFLPWGVAAAALVALVVALLSSRTPVEPSRATRFEVMPPAKVSGISFPCFSPDGTMIAFLGRRADSPEDTIWIRPLDAFEAYELAGTAGARRPFWSPDSRHLAFFLSGRLYKIAVGGGPAQLIGEAGGSDGSWGSGGVILFDGAAADPLRRIAASGGLPSEVLRAGGDNEVATLGWPEFLLDGRHFLIVVTSVGESAGPMIHVGALDESTTKPLVPTSSRVEYADGHIVYVLQDTLVAQPFDPQRLEVTGEPVPLASGVPSGGQMANFSVSSLGDVAYMTSTRQGRSELVWLDRSGKQLGTVGQLDAYRSLALSPDGTRVAYEITGDRDGQDLWVRDLRREAVTRVTTDPANDIWPVWSPDGAKVAFASNRDNGTFAIFTRAPTGTGAETKIFASDSGNVGPTDWSADGRFIACSELTNDGGWDLYIVAATGEGDPIPIGREKASEWQGRFSPDGRFIAYVSDESGRNEVYVQPVPPTGQRWTVSTGGGVQPAWRGDGKELFYLGLGTNTEIIGVPVRLAESFEAGLPETVLSRRIVTSGFALSRYAVAPGGDRFLVNTDAQESTAAPFSVILHALN